MKKILLIISGAVLLLGCATLSTALLVSAVAPNIFRVYLTANPSSFSHVILYPGMSAVYLFSAAQIIAGAVGIFRFGVKEKKNKLSRRAKAGTGNPMPAFLLIRL